MIIHYWLIPHHGQWIQKKDSIALKKHRLKQVWGKATLTILVYLSRVLFYKPSLHGLDTCMVKKFFSKESEPGSGILMSCTLSNTVLPKKQIYTKNSTSLSRKQKTSFTWYSLDPGESSLRCASNWINLLATLSILACKVLYSPYSALKSSL